MRSCCGLPELGGALFALLMSTSVAGAQTVRGRLLPPAQGPVPAGLLVELVDSANAVVARALAGGDGRFRLRAPRSGTYRVRALRIGFRPTISGTVALAAGEEQHLDVALGSAAVVLAPVDVAERRVCEVNPDTASRTAAAWGEVLKALALSELTRASRQYQMRIALFTRQLDRGGRFVSQTQSERDGSAVQPFKAMSPDSLARHGYVEMQGANGTYYGPDAQVLLSDAFARTHCLRLVPRESTSPADSGWIGIAFEPIRDDRPDIAGVLWLDRHSSELREVDYRYVSLHPTLEAARPGGQIVFQPLPHGGWIVRRWVIRMPVPGVIQTGISSRMEVMAQQESGGEVLTAHSGNRQIWTGRTSGIQGRVTMEAGAPPSGILLRLENTNRRALTDSTGRFAFDALLPGRYTVTAEARHLSVLGQPPMRLPVTVGDSLVTPLRVVIPSQGSAIARLCGEGTISDSLGLLRVIVTDSATRSPTPDVKVQASWHGSYARHADHLIATRRRRWGEQVGPGVFWLCAVPKNQLIDLEITRANRLFKAETRIPSDSVFVDQRVRFGAP